MSKVFFDVGLSLDGYLAGPNRRPGNPLGDDGVRIHAWLFRTATFLELIGRPGGERSADDQLVKRIFARAGAHVMGRRMFDEGEVGWPEEAPFHAPVFVLTHAPREPWVRKGGTTFHFVTEGFGRALSLARQAAGDRDVRVSGGAHAIRQALEAGVIDDFTLHIAPVMLGRGLRLFEEPPPAGLALRQTAAIGSPYVTHVSYEVLRGGAR